MGRDNRQQQVKAVIPEEVTHFEAGRHNMPYPTSCKYYTDFLYKPSLIHKTELLLRNQSSEGRPRSVP